MAPHKRDRRRTLRSLYVWHRWLGIICALFVLWLSLTGIALNHTNLLGLDQARFSKDWLLRLYGMQPEAPQHGFAVAGNWISHAGGKLFFNAQPVADWHEQPAGVAALDGLILVVGEQTSVLLTPEGQIVERYRNGSDPERRPLDTQTKALPPSLRGQILAGGAGLELSGSRVLADLHSGRILGSAGPWIMDLAASGFIVLALTGLWLWWRFLQSQRQRERRQRTPHP